MQQAGGVRPDVLVVFSCGLHSTELFFFDLTGTMYVELRNMEGRALQKIIKYIYTHTDKISEVNITIHHREWSEWLSPP